MDQSATAAYHIGQLAVGLMVIALGVGGAAFFVIALVKAITTKRTGWIVAASISAVPLLGLGCLLIVGMAVGFNKGLMQSSEIAAARRGDPSLMLTAPMTAVTGNGSAYEISIPSISQWAKMDNQPPYDCLFSYRDAYVGPIVESIGLGSPDRVCEIAQKNLKAKATDYTFTTSAPIQIDGHSWLTYDVSATVSAMHIKYRFYAYADINNTVQIIAWTSPALFDHYAPVFDRIAKTFKLPK